MRLNALSIGKICPLGFCKKRSNNSDCSRSQRYELFDLFGAVILLGASLYIGLDIGSRSEERCGLKKKRSATMAETMTLAMVHYAAHTSIIIEVIVFAAAMFKASATITSML